MMKLLVRSAVEFLGTFWLVIGGVGAAVYASAVPNVGIGYLGVAFAFGFSLLTMAFLIGRVSGCHINPAVTLGAWAAGRFKTLDAGFYIVFQTAGAIAAAAVLFGIGHGQPGFSVSDGFGANGFGAHSPQGFNLGSVFAAEAMLTLFFLLIILGTTDPRAPLGSAPAAFAPLAIGLTLTLIHLVDIPIDNASVNPARSTGPAIFVRDWATAQLWLFWVAPIAGGIVGGLLYRALGRAKSIGE